MMRQTQILLLPEDEAAFSAALREMRPSVVFIEALVWNKRPITHDSLEKCSSIAGCWDPSIVSELPTYERPDGRFEGPSTGPVVQCERSRLVSDVLRSGTISASIHKAYPSFRELSRFYNDVWSAMRRVTSGGKGVECYRPSTGRVLEDNVSAYWVGHHAAAWAGGAKKRRLKDRSTKTFFRMAKAGTSTRKSAARK